ncbi:general transcription factor IIF subunit 2-like [Macadamia integrifolia]|uniref:general transcription factor IIF subunit 2-like n=1 Tax=Macadamia integrifolia TaxID=60698 RepID=UPI001C4EA0CD|nr:general transcription factor IIF subunit 2-like [Macadamia integrifolia]
MEDKCSHENLLETARADRAVWLMKFPPVVSRSWKSSTDSTRPLAKVVISVDPLRSSDDNSSPQFTMELNGSESGNAPKCYSLNMSEDFVPMCVFSQTSQGKVSVEGKVLNKFDMKPHNEHIGDYGKLCRERTNKYMTKARQVQVIDDNRGVHMRPMPGLVGLLPSGAKDKKKTVPVKGSEMKRTRRDRGEMEDIMFKLFERQPNWTLRQLIQETDQPEQFVKDLLKDLCVYNNKGTNQGSYELKPEYKRAGEAGPG